MIASFYDAEARILSKCKSHPIQQISGHWKCLASSIGRKSALSFLLLCVVVCSCLRLLPKHWMPLNKNTIIALMMEISAGSGVAGLSQLVKLKLGNYVKCDHLKSNTLRSLSMEYCMLEADRVFDSPVDLPSLDSLQLVLWTESEKSGKDWQAGGPKSQIEKKVCLVCLLVYTTLVYRWWDHETILKIP